MSLRKKRRDYLFRKRTSFTPVKREEVRGVDVLLGQVDEIINRINNFSKLDALGIDIGGGALFYGPKGTGKTYLAQYFASAVKNSAKFVDMRDFPKPVSRSRGMEYSLLPEDIRLLFKLAREYVLKNKRPIILCYDEFEEVDDDVIEELRIQLSGMERRINGIYLLFISTSSPEDIDDRLFRAGRISDLIEFSTLTPRGREEVLRFWVSQNPHSKNINFKSIISISEEIDTPAVLASIANAAYREAIYENMPNTDNAKITQRNVTDQYLRYAIGRPTEETLFGEELKIVAIHEAGHAVMARICGISVQFVSILPQLRNPEQQGITSVEISSKAMDIEMFLNYLAFCFGGLIAQRFFGYENFLGYGGDIKALSMSINEFIETYGGEGEIKKKYGHVHLARAFNEYSDELRETLERDKGRLSKRALCRAYKVIDKVGEKKVKKMIGKIADALIKKKILLGNEIEEILK